MRQEKKRRQKGWGKKRDKIDGESEREETSVEI